MWWLFGLINMIVVIGFAWLYHKKVKEDSVWYRDDKVALGTMLVLAFLGGFIVSAFFAGLFVYLIIDFIKYMRK